MDAIKDWLAIWGALLSILVICGLLDQPPAPASCIAAIRDGGGHVHYISGQIAHISTD